MEVVMPYMPPTMHCGRAPGARHSLRVASCIRLRKRIWSYSPLARPNDFVFRAEQASGSTDQSLRHATTISEQCIMIGIKYQSPSIVIHNGKVRRLHLKNEDSPCCLCIDTTCGVFAVSLRCVCGAFAVRLRCVCRVFAVCLRCVCCVFAVCLRCVCGVFAVCLRCVCGVFAVCLRYVLLPKWGVQITQKTPRRPYESSRKHQRHPGASEGGTQEPPRRHSKAAGTEGAPSGHRWTKMYQKCDTVVKNEPGTIPPAESVCTLSAPPETLKAY